MYHVDRRNRPLYPEPDLKRAGTAVLLAVLSIGGMADPATISSAEDR
jgi:hypothetical protein